MNEHLSERVARGRKFQARGNTASDPNHSKEPLNRDIRAYVLAANSPPANTAKPWLLKSEIPTSEEILDDEEEPVELSENRMNRPWPNRKKYLETHYELLREDAISPLRDAVHRFKSTPDMFDDNQVAVYEKVGCCSFRSFHLLTMSLGLHRWLHFCSSRTCCANTILNCSSWQKHRVGILQAVDFGVDDCPYTFQRQF
jgi:hypothetical protein